MDRDVLQDILLSQNRERMTKEDAGRMVPRTLLQKIAPLRETPFVIIISGVRRCGKSTLLQLLKTKDAYYVNFDDERFVDFSVKDFQQMYDALRELFGEKDIFLFDEIQNVAGWERFVRRLQDEKKKIYVTGSNASMLSRELGTHLTGRNIPVTLAPFSFKEFLDFKKCTIAPDLLFTSKEKSNLKRLFEEYLAYGGFPEYLITRKEEYIQSVYQNIIYRDIITRYGLSSERQIKETVFFAASNIGKEVSFNTIRKLTGLSSATTVKEYFAYLENSYLVFLVPRYDFSLKKQAYFNKKVYCIDTALARIVGFRPSEDKGRILENVVFLSLRQRYQDIYFHKERHECDFIARTGARIDGALQITYSLGKNRERELNGLGEAMKKYRLKEGTILTYDEEEEFTIDRKKIRVKPVWKWLLENE